MNEQGFFAAIEGGDGSGKGTQTELLLTHVRDELGKKVMKLSFPRYGEPSAYYVEQYLNGAYGSVNEVPADLAVLPFAIDRSATKDDIRDFLNTGGLVLTDRFVASNLAHHGTKIDDPYERQLFYERTMRTEYEVLGIPRPDLNIVLLVPSEIAQQNVDKKAARSYTNLKRDIHEADANHLDKAKRNYEELCQLYPDEFIAVECMDDSGTLRSIDDIQQEIRSLLPN